MRDELKALHSEIGVTAIYVTHDQAEAMSLSDTIVVMGDGEILQRGSPRQLYEEPADVRVATFIGKTNLVAASFIEANKPHARVRIRGLAETVLCRSADHAAEAAGSLSIRPEGVRLKPATDGTGGIEGRVASATYLGDICRYDVVLGDDRRLEAQQSAVKPFAVGDAVRIELDPDHCYFIVGREPASAREPILREPILPEPRQ
jgi:iron(III) transport system ATP-binding protein